MLSTNISPLVGNSNPEIRSIKVVLPEPVFPRIPIVVFFFIVKLTLSKILLFFSYSNEAFTNFISSLKLLVYNYLVFPD